MANRQRYFSADLWLGMAREAAAVAESLPDPELQRAVALLAGDYAALAARALQAADAELQARINRRPAAETSG
jgi:hypothetical protein